jgi:ATP-dependent helicase HrpB
MLRYPIDDILHELKEAVLKNPSVVLHAPPGAGKTTRVPLVLLDVLAPENGRIIVLEPRRIAAVSAARWMARTLGQEAGGTVGYSIRFDSRVSSSTRIEVVTEGILTRRIQADPGLKGVAMVIFDEFHERSLHTDLALALCLDIRRGLREDLKLLVMSATLECGPVSELLGGAPVITSGGKIFPVEERYIAGGSDKPLTERITGAVSAALSENYGDILVFLPGAGEIRACARALQSLAELSRNDFYICSLYGDLPFEEQERAILPSTKRKIVLATNIAETSLTIEGVGVVIDSGLTRRLQYDPTTGMNRLMTASVSKASAEQRKGRAGRTGPGICYRLYSRYAFQSMVPFTPPEILVSDLSAQVLELAAWGVKDPSELAWLDKPPAAAWAAATHLLKDMGALDMSGSVTPAGRAMSRLPLHPRLARMLVRAGELGHIYTGADLAALLSERDILRLKTVDHNMTDVREPDISERTDMLQAWREGKDVDPKADMYALRAVERTATHLIRLMPEAQKSSDREPADAEMIARLLLCAFPDRIARRREDGGGRFVLAQGRGVRLPPMSRLGRESFIIAVSADAGEKGEGVVYLAALLTEKLIREECAERIETLRRVEWDKRENRIMAVVEERVGGVVLSSKPFIPADEEAAPFLCEAIRSNPGMLFFGKEARQFLGRLVLMRKVFPEETWPDISDESLASNVEGWLLPWLQGMRSKEDLAGLDILPALKAHLSREQTRLTEERLPNAIVVPSGRRITLDYSSGDMPVLAVKLQEMFGLAETPVMAGGRVKVLIHLLSPAGRPVQITQDLKGFWNTGYKQVKKELKGRYPKHPWPDDPWNAAPTRRTKPRGR